ncbi:MAG TPA: phospholipase D family protein, partial [Mycobacteriales bacterium]|nr:phospholipase D family protein [Mycobacteriales bacterium]
ETALFSDDPTLVNAFKTKFDRMWNDTTLEPESINGAPPYLKDWADACRNEPMGCDFFQQYPSAKPMVINTARLEPDYPMPADLIWGQGPDFNNRLVQEINNEPSSLQFVIYRLTVDNITNALLARWQAGVQMKLIIEPGEYTNRKWPEFWLTHANLDKLWAAGVPIRQRAHQGLTHMKTLVTGAYATNASSNYAGAWQRDHDYFVSSATKSAIYTAIKNRVTTMWNDSSGFVPFQPQPPDAANLATPAQNAAGVPTNAPLVWNIAAFATDYDVYLGLSPNLTRMANVRAELSNSPPSTYQWTPPAALCTGTTYYWQIVSRTNATPVNPSMAATSPVWSFTTTGANNGCSGLPGSGGGGGGTDNVPAPWTTQDIGNVGVTGNATYASGVFTVRGAGSDIWDAADSFRYVSQPISGDGTIVARVTSVQNTNSSAKAGVMLRQALTAGSAHVILDVTPTGHVEFMTRASSGGQTSF